MQTPVECEPSREVEVVHGGIALLLAGVQSLPAELVLTEDGYSTRPSRSDGRGEAGLAARRVAPHHDQPAAVTTRLGHLAGMPTLSASERHPCGT